MEGRVAVARAAASVARRRRIMLLDFDQTVAATHVWMLLNGADDPRLLDAVGDDVLWGGRERLGNLQAWWSHMSSTGVEVHLVSHNWACIVKAALARAGLRAASVEGRETVQRKGVAVNRILATLGAKPSDACFVDDDPDNIREVAAACRGITTLQSPETGLQHEHIRVLTQWSSPPTKS